MAPHERDDSLAATLAARSHYGDDSFPVTDAQIQAVLEESRSEREASVVILTSVIATGLRRWDAPRSPSGA